MRASGSTPCQPRANAAWGKLAADAHHRGAGASHYHSSDYLNLKPITQRTCRSTIEPFREQHGDKRVAAPKREHIKGIIVKLADRPTAANNWLKTIKILMCHALETEMRTDGSCLGILKPHTGSSGSWTWTEEGIETFYARHPTNSRARLDLDLLLYTGQPRAE